MIILRKNPFSETANEVKFVEGEKADKLLERTLKENNYESAIKQGFHVVVNGHAIDQDLLPFVEIKETDTVVIAPIIQRGSGGQLFKQIAAVVLVVVGAALMSTGIGSVPGAGLTGMGLALATAAIAIGTTIALNALIPPPGLGLGGIGGQGAAFEGSQMYSITGQSNNAKKYGYVPRAYGTHRMFPIVAANPYTEIEADPATGNLVQFFYAIYDFGFGPLDISEIKIGETPITDYADSSWRLVDLNKPAVSEGYWDDKLNTDFQLYKGDIERDGTLVALDKNETDKNAKIDDYMAIRSASPKSNGDKQEITLDFVCPNGLIAYGTDGKEYDRIIDLNIHFSKVNEENWIPYNDLDNVFDFSSAGGSSVSTTRGATVSPLDAMGGSPDLVFLGKTADIYTAYYGGGFGFGGGI